MIQLSHPISYEAKAERQAASALRSYGGSSMLARGPRGSN